jgi:PPK2 family polyphosphate:nucleotide phosphotransferase
MDTSGKDGVVRGLFQAFDPQGCRVKAFKAPTPDEAAHDFLWRCHAHAPARGEIVIFNRSHYEDVVTARVLGLVPEPVWRLRYAAINAFERLLADSGIAVLKLFLHISRAEQKRRLEKRLTDPAKRWKFDSADLRARLRWDDYMTAYADAIAACSAPHAPWNIIPAERKWYRDLVVAREVAATLGAMVLSYPDRGAELRGIVIPD